MTGLCDPTARFADDSKVCLYIPKSVVPVKLYPFPVVLPVMVNVFDTISISLCVLTLSYVVTSKDRSIRPTRKYLGTCTSSLL